MNSELRAAAQAVIERWDTPLWKDVPATAEYIHRLRVALAAATVQQTTECESSEFNYCAKSPTKTHSASWHGYFACDHCGEGDDDVGPAMFIEVGVPTPTPINTLEEAITHAEEKAKGNSACAQEHAKLAAWLTELKMLRTAIVMKEHQAYADIDSKGVEY